MVIYPACAILPSIVIEKNEQVLYKTLQFYSPSLQKWGNKGGKAELPTAADILVGLI